MKKIILFLAPILFVSMVVILLVQSKKADANPSFFLQDKSAAASSTISYMTAGTGTTTNAFDTQGDGGFPTDSAVLGIILHATSTGTVLNWKYEYADSTANVDCSVTPLSCDWFQERLSSAVIASTTVMLQSAPVYSWTFATSSNAGGVSGITGTSTLMIDVPTPTRYVRVVFFLPVGSQNGAVWSEWIGKKQR